MQYYPPTQVLNQVTGSMGALSTPMEHERFMKAFVCIYYFICCCYLLSQMLSLRFGVRPQKISVSYVHQIQPILVVQIQSSTKPYILLQLSPNDLTSIKHMKLECDNSNRIILFR